ncbi:MAG: nucleotidyltransferase domain-containing protein [Thermoplasmata archaeon]
MDGSWKLARLSEVLGIPLLDTRFVPPGALVELREKASGIEALGSLIIYGSVVRGEASPKSDIDLLAVPARRGVGGELERALTRVLRGIEKKHNLRLSFSLMVYSGKEDPHFLWEAVRDGAVLFCRPETALRGPATAQPVALVSYSLKGLGGAGRQRIRRFIFESKKGISVDRGNRQEYIAPGALLLSPEKARRLIAILDSLRVRYSLIKLWR